MIPWVREGMDATSLRAVVVLYLVGIGIVAPIALLIALVMGIPRGFQVTPVLVIVFIFGIYLQMRLRPWMRWVVSQVRRGWRDGGRGGPYRPLGVRVPREGDRGDVEWRERGRELAHVMRAMGIHAGMAVPAAQPFETMTEEEAQVSAAEDALTLDPVTCCGRTFTRFSGEDTATCYMAHRRRVHPEGLRKDQT